MVNEDFPLRGFACPHLNRQNWFLEALVIEHARQTLSLFRERYVSQGQQHGSGLVGLITDSTQWDLSFETVWDPAFGGIYAGLSKCVDSIDQRAAALALRLHECGYGGDWELHLAQPHGFRFDRWVLPAGDTIRVSATHEQVCVAIRVTSIWHNVTFHQTGNEWQVTGEALALPLLNGPQTRWIVLDRAQLWTWEVRDIADNIMDCGPELMVSRCEDALAVLRDYAPVYFLWVSKVIRFIAPWQVKPGQHPSGSSSSNLAPGLVGIGNHNHAISLADSLIHEATHHYYYIAKRLGDIDDRTDEALYYNPFLKTKRPIDRILLAYHAFGNVLLFCRMAIRSGLVDDSYVLNREQQLAEQLKILEKALQYSRALTQLGRALWEPLYEQIHG